MVANSWVAMAEVPNHCGLKPALGRDPHEAAHLAGVPAVIRHRDAGLLEPVGEGRVVGIARREGGGDGLVDADPVEVLLRGGGEVARARRQVVEDRDLLLAEPLGQHRGRELGLVVVAPADPEDRRQAPIGELGGDGGGGDHHGAVGGVDLGGGDRGVRADVADHEAHAAAWRSGWPPPRPCWNRRHRPGRRGTMVWPSRPPLALSVARRGLDPAQDLLADGHIGARARHGDADHHVGPGRAAPRIAAARNRRPAKSRQPAAGEPEAPGSRV